MGAAVWSITPIFPKTKPSPITILKELERWLPLLSTSARRRLLSGIPPGVLPQRQDIQICSFDTAARPGMEAVEEVAYETFIHYTLPV
jgi:hypothetical protein